jgi:energy-coupling factor transport system ATP-binding protein
MDIQIDSLTYAYPTGVKALQGVTLRIGQSEKVAIIGQNGAGKTTLVKHINGLLKPGSGSVRVGDWDTRQWTPSKLAARVGYVFQNPDDQLFKPSVWSEVTFGPKNLGWEPERTNRRASQALEAVGLQAVENQHPYDLSLSQRKNVALAAVLAMDTPVVILDEPTTGQDFPGLEQIGRIVEALKQEAKTVITITHDIDFCAEHFDRVVVMAGGIVLLDGPAREVLAQYDALAAAYVEPPQLMRLASRLRWGSMPLTVDEFIQEMGKLHSG